MVENRLEPALTGTSASTVPYVGHPGVRPEWLARHIEEPIDPDLPIVDTHHHLSDDFWGGYGDAELLADLTSGHQVRASVFVQCLYRVDAGDPDPFAPVAETEAVVQAAGRLVAAGAPAGTCAGIIGHADLRLGAGVGDVLDAHLDAGDGRFRGIRVAGARDPHFTHGILAPPPAGLYLDSKFREGFALLEPRQLTFDAWVFHPQLDDVFDLARSFPGVRIIVDHVGAPLGVGPYRNHRAEVFEAWRRDMSRLATLPNTMVKLGGLGMSIFGFDFDQESEPPTSERLADAWNPYIESCIELFGTSRCMFESNFPVDKGTASYSVIWNAFKRITEHATDHERADLFHDTAITTYSLSREGHDH